MSDVTVLGADGVGVVAECDGFRYYLTPCCGASSKGLEGYVGCRACYAEVDPELGGCPDREVTWSAAEGVRFTDKPLALVEVYGDGLPYDEWKRTLFARS